ncbi:ATP-dependent Clp protease ATP-binding subunit [Fusibacter bizertensis]
MLEYNFSEIANDVINFAFAEARDLGHRYIGTEHILLGLSLIKGTKVSETFLYYRVTAKDIRLELIKLIGETPVFEGIIDYTLRAKECLERSHAYALKSNNGEILPEHIFMSIVADKQSIGYKVLSKLSLDLTKIANDFNEHIEEASNLIKANKTKTLDVKVMDFDHDYADSENGILQLIGTDLTELVKDQPDEITVGRTVEIERMIQILTRKAKNNPCLIGEPGVGKTQIVRGLARRIASGDVPHDLKETKIYEINVGGLVSGTMFRGQFEERMNELIKVLTSSDKIIAFFDEIHALVGIGATGEKAMDAFTMLKPFLNTGKIRIIGATTYSDYQKYIEIDHAVSRRLMLVNVEEPTIKDTMEILKRIKGYYESHHHVAITDQAVKSAVELSERYIRDRKLPDKAIDIIDEACSRKRSDNLKTKEIVEEIKYRLAQLKEEKENYILELKFEEASKIQKEEKRILEHIERNQQAKNIMNTSVLVVDEKDVELVVSDWARVPVHKLSSHDKERLKHLEVLLSDRVIGQTDAIAYVARALKRFRVGIKESGKPLGSFLFVGPTGVGKTELAKSIADLYFGSDKNLIKLDMTEYMERHSVAKLIGSPPGYEGTKEGGILTNAISKMPFSVIVFDEIEKAHPDISNILLQIMDEGTLTDGRGRIHDFRNALVILTSNLGTDDVIAKQVGFVKNDEIVERESQLREACKRHFKPEFINRIDEIVVFNNLDLMAITTIVRHQLDELIEMLSQRGIELHFSDKVAETIAEQSYSQTYGARPIRRAIDKLIKDPLAELMIDHDSLKVVDIFVVDDTIEMKEV